MKTFYSVLVCAVLFMVSCKKENIPAYGNDVIVPPQDTQTVVLYTGTLIGGEFGDRARGDVSIEKAGSRYYLLFKNFTSYNGPDLHVYFSKTIGNNATPPVDYIDLGFLKYLSGTFHYALTGQPDVANYKYVMIWCAQYRIQFGYSELK
ncbi:MAG: DM13 domain-containing protein [Chitinophagaceae bacterium]|nr:DM13 domain-containing protein [Chitinophagaceae bacterium]